MKTSELTGLALDWAVAKCDGITVLPKMRGGHFVTLNSGETVLLCYSTDWAQGGPIIEREMIELVPQSDSLWDAMYRGQHIPNDGPTPLIAAMRCYVASKLGDEVELPKELL